ncbi:MAG: hypothetical protein Q8R44_05115 [Novosphingobium sp.]|nr:hypothetical protein [Novosphingobium sp.]
MLKSLFKRVALPFQLWTGVHELRKGNAILQAQEYARLRAVMAVQNPGNVALEGYKVYSQTDEDGIIAAIFERIANAKVFLEIGVQTGVECNSLLLLLKGWRGSWIEGNPAACRKIADDLGGASFDKRFRTTKSFVTRENIVALVEAELRFLDAAELDFFSLDIDGNDLHCMRELLAAKVAPKVVCVEYQGKFPPPLSVTVDYAPDHVWNGTDYMGSSLQAFVDLFAEDGYHLLTCNIPGINAFFVRGDLAGQFADIPVAELYQPYRPWLSPFVTGQPPALDYLKRVLAGS